MTLYEIDKALEAMADEMTDLETGEFVGSYEDLERLNMERETKIENTGCYIKNLRSDIEALKAEETALKHRREVLQNRVDWLSEYLRRSLDGQNFETARVQMRWKKNPETVSITDPEQAMIWAKNNAPEAIKVIPPELIKTQLKRVIKSGVEIPGCELKRETRLEVK